MLTPPNVLMSPCSQFSFFLSFELWPFSVKTFLRFNKEWEYSIKSHFLTHLYSESCYSNFLSIDSHVYSIYTICFFHSIIPYIQVFISYLHKSIPYVHTFIPSIYTVIPYIFTFWSRIFAFSFHHSIYSYFHSILSNFHHDDPKKTGHTKNSKESECIHLYTQDRNIDLCQHRKLLVFWHNETVSTK